MKIKWNKTTVVASVISLAAVLIVVALTYWPKSLPPTNQGNISEDLRRIASSDLARDFQKAVSRKDFRLIGLKTVGLEIPGVASFADHLKYKDLLGVRIIEATGDVLLSKEHAELQEKVRRYATVYNTMLLQYIKENPSVLKLTTKDSL
jgi:hypothetical protein